jgi:hypothetical protein
VWTVEWGARENIVDLSFLIIPCNCQLGIGHLGDFLVNEKKQYKNWVKTLDLLQSRDRFWNSVLDFFFTFACIWKWQEAGTEFKIQSSFLRLSFKLSPNFLLIYSNTQPLSFLSSFSQSFLQNRHCYCCKSFQLKFSFSTDPEPVHIHHFCLTNILSFFYLNYYFLL